MVSIHDFIYKSVDVKLRHKSTRILATIGRLLNPIACGILLSVLLDEF